MDLDYENSIPGRRSRNSAAKINCKHVVQFISIKSEGK